MDKKKGYVCAYVSPEEKEEIVRQASCKNISVSDYIRNKLFNDAICAGDENELKKDTFYTVRQVASLLNVSENVVRRMCRDRELSYHKTGTRYRFLKSDIDIYMDKKTSDKYEDLPELMTVEQISKFCYVTPATVNSWINKGLLPAYKLNGSRYRVEKDEVWKFITTYNIGLEIKEDLSAVKS